ncbi:probable pectinesterase 55 [Rhodamnia argentea]|uniref:pectinesterase n=1 Tax=Rhodamnia argentea TaxID=178133 RepID=A0A8B8QE90_9MYRT|nr:probable pectinesterase 55 [Rhodamnia argentea]
MAFRTLSGTCKVDITLRAATSQEPLISSMAEASRFMRPKPPILAWSVMSQRKAKKELTAPSAFVFKSCRVTGEGRTYLGRAWRKHSRVLFYNTSMTEVIVPEGWSSWSFQGHEEHITYAEVGCTGKGANKSRGEKRMKDLPPQELEYFLSNRFMNQEHWIKAQPY